MWYNAPDCSAPVSESEAVITRTSTRLLADLHDPGNLAAWDVFNRRYRPIVVAFAKRCGLQHADAEDVAQETMAEFLRAYHAGRYDRNRGSRLRDWLKGIAANRVRDFARRQAKAKEHQPPPSDSQTTFLERVPDEEVSDQWNREWVNHLLSLCIDGARREFDSGTSRAFELYAISQRPADDVASQLGMTRNAVYIAKSRVLARLHEMFADLDEPTVSL